jgi:4'-phosphopantetheinyl transferase
MLKLGVEQDVVPSFTRWFLEAITEPGHPTESAHWFVEKVSKPRVTMFEKSREFVHSAQDITDISPSTEWLSPHPVPKLTGGEVHIWRAPLALAPEMLTRLKSTLSEDELARVERFVFDRDATSFTAARGILRDLLGRYLACPPQSVHFAYGAFGKPELAPGRGRLGELIRFNLSHSHGLALFALAIDRNVGIDLEMIRPDAAAQDIAARYFSADETKELKSLPVEEQDEGFFTCWTRKEAYVKARGNGLQIPLDSFSVTFSPGQPAILSAQDGTDWSIESFVPAVGKEQKSVAAFVVEGREYRRRFFEWSFEYPKG